MNTKTLEYWIPSKEIRPGVTLRLFRTQTIGEEEAFFNDVLDLVRADPTISYQLLVTRDEIIESRGEERNPA